MWKGFGCIRYIYHRGAFGVARFDKSGNSRASTREASDRDWLHVFFVYVCYLNYESVAVVAE